jgi:negative regulator of sigma E activity
MSDRVREAVSVFMDGEADELSVRRLVVQEDAELVRAGWSSYHRQRRVLQGADLRFEQMDISLSVMAALDAESTYSERDRRAWLKPVAGFAVAASVAAIVVVSAPDWRQAGHSPAATLASTDNASPTQIATPFSASQSSSQALAVDTSPDIRLGGSVYVDNSDMNNAPVLQGLNGGIPASLQTGSSESFMYSMPSRNTAAVQYQEKYPEIRINGMSQHPVLYSPVSRSVYSAELNLPAQK